MLVRLVVALVLAMAAALGPVASSPVHAGNDSCTRKC